jgi:hypothetical protein
MANDLLVVFGTLAGATAGGLIAGWPAHVARRDGERRALRVWRDNLYNDQIKLAATITNPGHWWSDVEDLRGLGSDEEFARISASVDGDAWEELTGARRRMIRLEVLRVSAIRRGQDNPPKRDESQWVTDELPRLYREMERSREHLASADHWWWRFGTSWEFEPHPTRKAVEDVVGPLDDLPELGPGRMYRP